MNDIAVAVAKHLHLDMARALNIFLDKDVIVAKARRRFTPATGQRIGKILRPTRPAACPCRRRPQPP